MKTTNDITRMRLQLATRLINCFVLALVCLSLSGCITYTIDTAKGVPRDNGHGAKVPLDEPRPEYYWFVPLTIPADIATSPCQGLFFFFVWATGWHDC